MNPSRPGLFLIQLVWSFRIDYIVLFAGFSRMLTTRPRLAPSRTAGLTDRYKRAWALHMKKYGRFGWYVDPVELEKRLKAARKHLSKWGCCR